MPLKATGFQTSLQSYLPEPYSQQTPYKNSLNQMDNGSADYTNSSAITVINIGLANKNVGRFHPYTWQ